MRNFLIALLALLWLILGWLYHRDYKECCAIQNVTIPIISDRTGPILFNWGSSAPILGEGWPSMRDSIARTVGENSKLEIVGHYCLDGNPAETEAVGMSRAQETRKLFSELAEDKLIFLSNGVSCDTSYKGLKFESVAFNTRVVTSSIIETEDKTEIYFPFNSSKKLDSKDVETYLDDVAKRVIASSEKVVLTGHTDNVGSNASNSTMGQTRADVIKAYLVSKGVRTEMITATSKGEESPKSDNNTEEGRAQNRRTDLQIIK